MMVRDHEQKPRETVEQDGKDAAALQKEFLEMVESKLKRSEKDIWFVENHDNLNI